MRLPRCIRDASDANRIWGKPSLHIHFVYKRRTQLARERLHQEHRDQRTTRAVSVALKRLRLGLWSWAGCGRRQSPRAFKLGRESDSVNARLACNELTALAGALGCADNVTIVETPPKRARTAASDEQRYVAELDTADGRRFELRCVPAADPLTNISLSNLLRVARAAPSPRSPQRGVAGEAGSPHGAPRPPGRDRAHRASLRRHVRVRRAVQHAAAADGSP